MKQKVLNLFRKYNTEKETPFFSGSERMRVERIPRFTSGKTFLYDKEFFFCDSISFISSLDEIFFQEIYRFDEQDSEDLIMIDCGANIGLATLYLKFKYPSAKILAFEPDPAIFSVLEKNIQSFNLQNIELYNQAIGDKNEVQLFNMEGGHSGMIVNKSSSNSVSVTMVSLAEQLAKFKSIDFLKIDIEGYEIEVLPTVASELKKVKRLFLEYHTFLDRKQELSRILNIIEDAGFRYYIKEAANKKTPFTQGELFYKMDMLVNIFCYR